MKKSITLVYQGYVVLVIVRIYKQNPDTSWSCISERVYREMLRDVVNHLQDFDTYGQRQILSMLLIEKEFSIEFEIE
jgi:hypothetical protein